MPGADATGGRIREARLLVAQPEVVFDELKIYAEQITKGGSTSHGDDELEKSLAARNDPLIDLGLACYGSSPEVVAALYKKGLDPALSSSDARYRKGLRIACLSNQSVPAAHSLLIIFEKYPDLVLGGEELRRVLAEADSDEAEALICNPYVSDSLLQDLYERSEPFSQFDEDRWRDLVFRSRKNSRLVSLKYEGHEFDHGHFLIQKAIFQLLQTAPATSAWLHSLHWLLDSLDPRNVFSPDKIDDAVERWGSVAVDDANGNPLQGYFTSVSLRDEFRCAVAALYGRAFRDSGIVILGSATAPDVALRCAYYGKARLTVKEMGEGYKRDKDVFVFAVLFNDHVYLTPPLRKTLEEKYLTRNPDGRHRYQRRCEQLHKHYRHFDPRPVSERMAEDAAESAQAPPEKLLGWAATMDTRVADVAKQVYAARQWVVWGVVVVVALILVLAHKH